MVPKEDKVAARIINPEPVTPADPLEVNINREMREDVRVALEATPINRKLFKPSAKHIYTLMEKDCFTRFRRSEEYKQWATL